MQTTRVWDLPTRLFHWLLALAVMGLVITGQVGGSWMDWHFRLGYCVLTLLLFRMVWGLVGGHWSRFIHFFTVPAPFGATCGEKQHPNTAWDTIRWVFCRFSAF
jgi:cytochrome b